jgi:hypothetical protein
LALDLTNAKLAQDSRLTASPLRLLAEADAVGEGDWRLRMQRAEVREGAKGHESSVDAHFA